MERANTIAMNLRSFCNTTIVSISENASLSEAALAMKDRSVGCALVTSSAGDAVGVLSDRDVVVRAVCTGKNLNDISVSSIMTKGVIKIDTSETIEAAVLLMKTSGIRRLFLTDGSPHICGIVATDDLVRVYGKQMGALSELFGQQDGTIARHRAHDFTRMA